MKKWVVSIGVLAIVLTASFVAGVMGSETIEGTLNNTVLALTSKTDTAPFAEIETGFQAAPDDASVQLGSCKVSTETQVSTSQHTLFYSKSLMAVVSLCFESTIDPASSEIEVWDYFSGDAEPTTIKLNNKMCAIVAGNKIGVSARSNRFSSDLGVSILKYEVLGWERPVAPANVQSSVDPAALAAAPSLETEQ